MFPIQCLYCQVVGRRISGIGNAIIREEDSVVGSSGGTTWELCTPRGIRTIGTSLGALFGTLGACLGPCSGMSVTTTTTTTATSIDPNTLSRGGGDGIVGSFLTAATCRRRVIRCATDIGQPLLLLFVGSQFRQSLSCDNHAKESTRDHKDNELYQLFVVT